MPARIISGLQCVWCRRTVLCGRASDFLFVKSLESVYWLPAARASLGFPSVWYCCALQPSWIIPRFEKEYGREGMLFNLAFIRSNSNSNFSCYNYSLYISYAHLALRRPHYHQNDDPPHSITHSPPIFMTMILYAYSYSILRLLALLRSRRNKLPPFIMTTRYGLEAYIMLPLSPSI